MSWHTQNTQTTTQQSSWHYHAHMVAPIELILNYEVKSLYLLKTTFPKKPAAPSSKPRSPALTLHRRFPRHTKPKDGTARPNPKNNNDQPNKNPTDAQSPNRGTLPAPCFLLPAHPR